MSCKRKKNKISGTEWAHLFDALPGDHCAYKHCAIQTLCNTNTVHTNTVHTNIVHTNTVHTNTHHTHRLKVTNSTGGKTVKKSNFKFLFLFSLFETNEEQTTNKQTNKQKTAKVFSRGRPSALCLVNVQASRAVKRESDTVTVRVSPFWLLIFYVLS